MAKDGDRAEKLWVALMKAGALTGCHQKYDRSFHAKGFQFPLCARCTGLLAGQLAGIAALAWGPVRKLSARAFLLPAAVSVAVLGTDGIGQLKGVWVSNNPRRFFTGLFCGVFTALLYVKLLAAILRKLCELLPQ